MRRDLIISIPKRRPTGAIGNKATNLSQLIRIGVRVPRTFILTDAAYRCYLNDDCRVIEEVAREIERKLDLTKKYAARSSANIEDHAEYSFAGQFKSVLNVQGRDAILQAIWSIWATTLSPNVHAYLEKMRIGEQDLHMAVILQEMVEPIYSGVSFSRNPITGMHETVVEAVTGLGTSLVQEGTTPARWVYRQGSFQASSEASHIPGFIIEEVVHVTRAISAKLKRNIDLEWVFDGKDLYWVQMRDITTLPDLPIYSNRMAREMLPGMLKPLIWSVNIQLMVGDKIRLITELIGPNHLEPQKLVRQFYYRAYFNMSLLSEALGAIGFQAESIERMLGMKSEEEAGQPAHSRHPAGFHPDLRILRLVPRLLRFILEKWRIAPSLARRLPELENRLLVFAKHSLDGRSPGEILQMIDQLYALEEEAAYNNVIIQILAYLYSAILFDRLRKMGHDPNRIDMGADGPDFHRFNPNYHIDLLHRSFFNLDPALQEQLKHATYADFVSDPRYDGFRKNTIRFMEEFGHLSDNGHDFSTKPWREDGDRILKMVINYAPPSRNNTELSLEKLDFYSLSIPWYHRSFLKPFFRRALRFRQLREHVSFLYTLGISLFRVYFLEMAGHFTRAGLLEQPEDIFYLEFVDVRQMVNGAGDVQFIREKVAMHKQAMEQARGASIPMLIYGEQPPPVQVEVPAKLSGTPTSPGYCTASVRVVTGLVDFAKIQGGEILVIPYSDVSWAPLFARAGGILSESGGILSHSSIVAREYGIPAVVSVSGAMKLVDGTLVTLNGYTGDILIHTENVNEGVEESPLLQKE